MRATLGRQCGARRCSPSVPPIYLSCTSVFFPGHWRKRAHVACLCGLSCLAPQFFLVRKSLGNPGLQACASSQNSLFLSSSAARAAIDALPLLSACFSIRLLHCFCYLFGLRPRAPQKRTPIPLVFLFLPSAPNAAGPCSEISAVMFIDGSLCNYPQSHSTLLTSTPCLGRRTYFSILANHSWQLEGSCYSRVANAFPCHRNLFAAIKQSLLTDVIVN